VLLSVVLLSDFIAAWIGLFLNRHGDFHNLNKERKVKMPAKKANPSQLPDAPRYFCRKCLALAREPGRFYKFSKRIDEPKIECPICTLMYVYTEDFSLEKFGDYLSAVGCFIEINDPGKQAADLEKIAQKLRDSEVSGPIDPSWVLSRAIGQAQAFVHFSSHRISPVILGALKLVALRVPVRGIIFEADEELNSNVREFSEKASMLTTKPPRGEIEGDNTPHRNILVIDGLLAFTGAEDLTPGRQHEENSGGDTIEAVTEVDRVISLHNKFFSPLWAKLSDLGEKIFMDPI
jgi:hypothetical protein